MIIKFHKFIRYYSHYQFNQISRHKFYNFFQFIYSSTRSFYIFIINFILTLSKSLLNNFDYIIFVIDKFFKVIIYIFDKNI